MPQPHLSHQALSIELPLSLFRVYVRGVGLEVWMSLVSTKRCAEYLFFQQSPYGQYDSIRCNHGRLTSIQPICGNLCNLDCFGQLSAPGPDFGHLRHKFICVGLGMVYTCRPHMHRPVMESAMISVKHYSNFLVRMDYIDSRTQDGGFLLLMAHSMI